MGEPSGALVGGFPDWSRGEDPGFLEEGEDGG